MVAWAGIPGGGNNGLVVLNLFVLNHDPVRQGASRGFMRSNTFYFVTRKHWLVVNRVVAFRDIVG